MKEINVDTKNYISSLISSSNKIYNTLNSLIEEVNKMSVLNTLDLDNNLIDNVKTMIEVEKRNLNNISNLVNRKVLYLENSDFNGSKNLNEFYNTLNSDNKYLNDKELIKIEE